MPTIKLCFLIVEPFVLFRHKRASRPKEPKSLGEIDISGPWSTTGGAKPVPFVIYDNGAGSSQRLIVFPSPEQLRQLAIATQWFMDATFKTAPRLFQQLYVIRAAVGESAISVSMP